MNNEFSKLRQTQKQESASEQEQRQNAEVKDFSSVDELLREDSAQTSVPSGIAVKLNKFIAQTPKPTTWWQHFFGTK